jgi:PAS domain S-box-containing protein
LANNELTGCEKQPRLIPDDASGKGARITAELAGLDDGTDPFAAAVRATRMPMVITNPREADNPIAFVNDAFCRLTGYSREEIIGRNCRFLQGPESDPAAVGRIRAAIEAQEPIEIDIRNHAKDGRPFWNRLLIAPVHDAGGVLTYFFASQFDVTVDRDNLAEANEKLRAEAAEREQVEEALRQSQKMEAVGQLTGGLAHDFNNLLTGITGSLEMLQSRLAQGRLTDFDRYITAAQGAAKRASALTHRLLAFSRRQTLAPKPTDVNRLVTGMEELIRRTAGPEITVEVVTAGGLWNTLIDPNQLENALLNLCINARDAMPEGGQLTIETGNRWLDVRAARDRDVPPGQYVTLCVSDTGTGMPPEVIRRAFDPFFTTKPIGMGTGLGLSMIYGFVRQSGGQARIYSEPGQGTMVCLYLPRQFGGTETVEEASDLVGAPSTGQGETVLVVDDEPTVRMLVSDVLEDLGYIAIEVADGAAGLRVLQSDARIDLLITDVGLPGGMNGRQVADAGRALRPGLKVLFITGYAENAVLSHGHLDPGMHVMTKPFAMDALAGRIKELITAP